MTEWKEYKLGEIADVRDGTHDSPKESNNGFPLVTSKNIKNGKIDLSNTYLISKSDYEFVNQRSKVDKWDILFSMIGTIGECAIVKQQPEYAIKNVGLFKTHGDKLLAYWIYYYFHSQQAKSEMRACIKGSTQQYISLTDLRNFPIELPIKEKQLEIVSILSSLDDKIDLLHRENATLEQMAETLFRQWFVVEAKEEWEEGKLGDICNYVNEKIDIGNVETGDYISTENMCPNKQGVVLASSVPENGKATKYRIDDVLLSNIRPYFKKIWLSDREGGCSADVLCIRGKNELYAFFSYYTIRQDEFFDYVMLGSKGCKMPRGDKSHIMNWPIIIPPKDELLKFNEIAKQGITKIRNNNKQIRTLIQMRDGLLPKLMNNEIKLI